MTNISLTPGKIYKAKNQSRTNYFPPNPSTKKIFTQVLFFREPFMVLQRFDSHEYKVMCGKITDVIYFTPEDIEDMEQL